MLQSGGKTRIVKKTEIQDDHLGEIKWRSIFDLLPSEESSKLGERKVNLVGIRIRRNLVQVQVQVQVAITRNRVIIRMKMQVQLSSGLKLKKSLNNQQTPPPSPRC